MLEDPPVIGTTDAAMGSVPVFTLVVVVPGVLAAPNVALDCDPKMLEGFTNLVGNENCGAVGTDVCAPTLCTHGTEEAAP